MTRSSTYPPADGKSQAFGAKYRGSSIQPNVVVLHTTEGTTWPTYVGGSTAPHVTALPDFKAKHLNWHQHFPLTMSARALRNEAGGVQTNTLNCVQVELIGTCDPKHSKSWDREGKRLAGRDYIYWPDAPEWALDGVAEFIAFLHREWALKVQAVPTAKWLPYPRSYGTASGQRMTGAAWSKFYGICGHQHVPENSHGDPGNIDIATILSLTKAKITPPKKQPATPAADRVWEIANKALARKMNKQKTAQWNTIRDAAAAISKEH